MNNSTYGKKGIQWLPKARSGSELAFKILGIIGLILSTILVFAAVYLPLTYRWSQTTWSDLSIDEIVYHLMMPMEGTGTGMVTQHIVKCVVPAAVVAVVFVAVIILIRKKIPYTGYIKGFAAAISIVLIANTAASFWKKMEVTEYMNRQSTYSSFIDENYVDPNSVTLTFPEQKRNLIYIFLESTECTFADKASGGAFEQNVIPELTQLGLENESFSDGKTLNGGHVMKGSTWTMGGMFAETSGLPLTINIDKNAMSTQENFFPGATVLGDILEDAGYNQTLLLGSDAVFGGRKLYFTTHGNYQIRDYNYYIENGTFPPDYYVWWGYEDKYLFENAKAELAKLSASDMPFNLTMLTVDTHFEDGYVCSDCRSDFDEQYSNVYACSSRKVAEFLEWLKTQPYYENTTVVISGDHLTMDSDYCNDVRSDYERKVYTTIINAPLSAMNTEKREFTTLDNFPTTLAALGVDIPGNRLALGVNLFSDEKSLYEIYGADMLDQGLTSKSELMDNLTAGITQKMVTLKAMPYDSETKSIQIIASDVMAEGDLEYLKANVTKADTGEYVRSYFGEDRGDGTWIFTIPFEGVNYEGGKYNIFIVGKDATFTEMAEFIMGAIGIEFHDPAVENVYVADDRVYGLRVNEFDFASGSFTVEYDKKDMSNVIGVSFAIWQNSDQSDIKWYEAEAGEDGVYRKSISAFDHTSPVMPYIIDAYVINADGSMEPAAERIYTIS